MKQTLRLRQINLEDGHYRVEFEVERGGTPALRATSTFEFREDAAASEDVRWYLEEYLQDPDDPAPARAVKVEQRIQDVGTALFEAVFLSSAACRRLWDGVSHSLNSTRIEIATPDTRELPWEMLFDPNASAFVASLAATFVRSPARPARTPARSRAQEGLTTTFW